MPSDRDPIAAIVAERLEALGWSHGELARRSGVAHYDKPT